MTQAVVEVVGGPRPATPLTLVRDPPSAARLVLDHPDLLGRAKHAQVQAARSGRVGSWPTWVPPSVLSCLSAAGIQRPWLHQVSAAEHAWAGRHVVVATGTASGKSLAALLPVLARLQQGGARALYLAPTKALAADHARAVEALAVPGVRVAVCDGDSSYAERDWARAHATYLVTNPDMLHRTLLPSHKRWAGLWRGLQVVVVDEVHTYRGTFGSHVAQVLRRLRRIAAHHGARPVFVLASATCADPAVSAGKLLGQAVQAVTEDSSPQPGRQLVLWQPPPTSAGEGRQRPAGAEAADLLSRLCAAGVPTLAFVRSRAGAEAIAETARNRLADLAPHLTGTVAAYRGGYLPEERRSLERGLRSGAITGLATTNALELGIDVHGLDAVVICGWPGSRASMWQQAGRAGRAGSDALCVVVARDDPLDTYLVHHPELVFGQPVESTVLDPDNPHVLRPHLEHAAAELPLSDSDLETFGPGAGPLVDQLTGEGRLRKRDSGWFWTRRERPGADLRGDAGLPVAVVELATGRLLGTVDAGSAQTVVHPGAVYVHQGVRFEVTELDLASGVALVLPHLAEWSTRARERAELDVVSVQCEQAGGAGSWLRLGEVRVRRQVTSFLRLSPAGEVLADVPLDLPERTLSTTAVWAEIEAAAGAGALSRRRIGAKHLHGAAHALEHAAVALLPLFATCDPRDVAGLSWARHPGTGTTLSVVHDSAAGGAGFAARAFETSREWLHAARNLVADCVCESGCPSCLHSAICSTGNTPLHGRGALALLDLLLE